MKVDFNRDKPIDFDPDVTPIKEPSQITKPVDPDLPKISI